MKLPKVELGEGGVGIEPGVEVQALYGPKGYMRGTVVSVNGDQVKVAMKIEIGEGFSWARKAMPGQIGGTLKDGCQRILKGNTKVGLSA